MATDEPPKRRTRASTPPSSTTEPPAPAPKEAKKAKGRALPVVVEPPEPTALSAAWPEAVLALSADDRKARVRQGQDTVLLDEVGNDGARKTRGFVRAVLKVPLGHPNARVYGVFVEVDKDAYLALRKAFVDKRDARVWGTLATRLPFLDDAYGSGVLVVEDGSDLRARVVDVKSASLRHGPAVGPRTPAPRSQRR
jgi:hypothetical protein